MGGLRLLAEKTSLEIVLSLDFLCSLYLSDTFFSGSGARAQI